ncbi:MAG: 3-phosphoshikimate 1-carboxyvinyltransferase [Deltaproteobacteria bacterium]|jgi:3-phosphoshikimate 1-carboxyvinyltransferase|nr:3-phosphoshikimate 1-carboxyvinyltransferase [Deltaproteobacteria bacterium]
MPLVGKFSPPGDKSISHRLVLMSLLAESQMLVTGLSRCDDVSRSLAAFRALGGRAEPEEGGLMIHGLSGNLRAQTLVEIDCGNSGTTMRLLMGLLAGRPGFYRLDGDRQLRARPMKRVADPLAAMGAKIETTGGKPPVSIEGKALSGGDCRVFDASAQLKSAVLLAGLSASSPTTITVPIATRDHTERLIAHWGGKIAVDGLKVTVQPGLLKLSKTFFTPGDPSSAAFLLTGAAMIPGSRVTAKNLLLSYGRIGFLRVLDRMGAKVSLTMERETPEPVGEVTVAYDGPLKATEITEDEVPSLIDEIPVLALAATSAEGQTVFRKVDELRIKETDRLMSIRHQLGALGARVGIEGDDLLISGPTDYIIPHSLDSGHDHRLAMTLVMALKAAKAEAPILGLESIPISYPDFISDLASLWKQ